MRRATLVLACAVCSGLGRPGASQSVADRIRARLEPPGRLTALYAARDYRPAWVSDSGPLSSAAELVAALEEAAADGLNPEDYRAAALRPVPPRTSGADALAELDLLWSRAFLDFGSDLALGRVDPADVDSLWTAARGPLDVAAALAAVEPGRVEEALHALRPPQDGYALLRLSLAWYRAVAARGGWMAVSDGAALGRGARGARVRRLRERLIASADLVATPESTDEPFDSTLQEAVRRFQQRHGLQADGVVGAATLAALNVPVGERIGQIELNLERWRWLPRDLGGRYLMVNIPAFALEVVDEGRVVMAMPVVVGRPDWRTPIVTATLTQLVFGPAWNIPRTIAVAELLPVARRDPRALARQRIHVYCESAGRAQEIDPDSVDWAAVSDSTFAFRLVQDPGPGNPLGGVKLVFPNRFDVAAHDTPDRRLLAGPVRTGSHGCVRLARAEELATLLLQDVSPWTADSVRVAMERPEERWVGLPKLLPVHLVYWTAWVDEGGALQFRPDVYGWDARLAEALAGSTR